MAQPSKPRTPICRLTTGDALIVWAVRHWVHSVKSRLDPRDLLRHGFATIDAGDQIADDMTEAVDRLLMITLHEATTVRDVGCVRCPTLGDGERDILQAIALAQRGRRDEAVEVVRTWLPPASALVAYEQVAALGRGLCMADLVLPIDRERLVEAWWIETVATHHQGSALVH
ncbi:MAG: hypothetical protein P1U88_11775 [Thalassobaculaceae bacterium]|nr:hypothetical protein [Thalassobaculaceae bacterium]